MFRKIADFIEEYGREREITLGVLRALKDEALSQRLNVSDWSIGQLACHLYRGTPSIFQTMGIQIAGAEEESTAKGIAEAYGNVSRAVIEKVKNSLTDADLDIVDNMYGQELPRRNILYLYLAHEVHHRAQLTILMRQAGLSVPNIYGPNREATEEMKRAGMK